LLVPAACVLALALGQAVESASCPELVGRWPHGQAAAVAVSGDVAYVGSGAALLVVDISNPAAPTVLGDLDLPELILGVATTGSHVIVCDGSDGVRILDAQDPTAPVEVGSLPTPGWARRATVVGNLA
jgi:hypothetical protein